MGKSQSNLKIKIQTETVFTGGPENIRPRHFTEKIPRGSIEAVMVLFPEQSPKETPKSFIVIILFAFFPFY